MKSCKLLYLGQDHIYFSNILSDLKSSPSPLKGLSLSFKEFYHHQLNFIVQEISKDIPHYILLDFTKNFDESLKIIHFLSISYPFSQIQLIGLMRVLPNKRQTLQLLSSKLCYYHIKSIEKNDFLNSFALYKGLKAWPELATAVLKDKLVIEHYLKLGFMTTDYLHIESNLDLTIGQRVGLGKSTLAGLFSQSFLIKRKMKENLYYPTRYAYDLEWDYNLYKPEDIIFDPAIDTSEEEFLKRKLEMAEMRERHLEKIENCKFLIKRFISRKNRKNSGKRTRLLIIDSDYKILQQSKKDLDLYPYSLRVCTSLDHHSDSDSENENKDTHEDMIKRVKAGIIAVVMNKQELQQNQQDQQVKQIKQGKQDQPIQQNLTAEKIINLISITKTIQGYSPFLIIFQGPKEKEAEALLHQLNYPKVIIDPSPFNFDLLMAYSMLYEIKDGRSRTHDKKLSFGHLERRAYLDKSESESIVPLNYEITLRNMNETLVLIESETPLPLNEKFMLSWPIPLTIVVIRSLDITPLSRTPTKGKNLFVGLIFGITEAEKQILRAALLRFFPKSSTSAALISDN